MSEIEKMYENAGVKKEVIKGCYEYYAENSGIDIYTVNDCKNKDCNTCKADKSIKEYPPFTAEKQIELIKWLARKGLIQINYSSHQCYQFNSFRVGGDYKTDISEALASHCNSLWQSLTEEEKQQVKGILE